MIIPVTITSFNFYTSQSRVFQALYFYHWSWGSQTTKRSLCWMDRLHGYWSCSSKIFDSNIIYQRNSPQQFLGLNRYPPLGTILIFCWPLLWYLLLFLLITPQWCWILLDSGRAGSLVISLSSSQTASWHMVSTY